MGKTTEMDETLTAEGALFNVKRSDVTELKALSCPPEGIKLIMEDIASIISCLKGIGPALSKDPKTGKEPLDTKTLDAKTLHSFPQSLSTP